MTWLLDLIFRRPMRELREHIERDWLNRVRANYDCEMAYIVIQNRLMGPAEYQRRCGHRLPLPVHMRAQEATNGPTHH